MPEYEEISNIAERAIRVLDRQRHHDSDATSHAVALQELGDLNREVREKYGSYPDGWTTFLERANTMLELSERHRGEGAWARRLDDVRERVIEARDSIFAAEAARLSAAVAAQQNTILLDRDAVKNNADLYRQAKRQAVTTGGEVRFVDN